MMGRVWPQPRGDKSMNIQDLKEEIEHLEGAKGIFGIEYSA
jgi:hypothetical protein